MSVDTLFSHRQFLSNDPADIAAISAEIKSGDETDDYIDFGAILQITDGRNNACFDFGVYGTIETRKDRAELLADLRNTRDSAHRLHDAIAAFVAHLDGALVDVEETLEYVEK